MSAGRRIVLWTAFQLTLSGIASSSPAAVHVVVWKARSGPGFTRR